MHYDTQYLDIVNKVLSRGVWKSNRTSMGAKFIPSASIVWDLRAGFPLLTTKKVYYKQGFGEVAGFLRGASTVSEFEELGCRWWASDSNENATWLASPYRKGVGDLGKIYGKTWRSRDVYKEVVPSNDMLKKYLTSEGYKYYALSNSGKKEVWKKNIDQLEECCNLIINNPTNRRNIFHAWYSELFDEMALPPCHVMYEFVVDDTNDILHMTMTQRSADLLLGVPMNLLGAALVLEAVAKATKLTAGVLTHNMTDVHLYENQIIPIKEQLGREPYIPPTVALPYKKIGVSPIEYLEQLNPHDILVVRYIHHDPIAKVDMAQELNNNGIYEGTMSNRISQDEYISRVNIANPDIDCSKIIYTGHKNPVDVRCNICDHEWTTTACVLSRLVNTKGCPNCPKLKNTNRRAITAEEWWRSSSKLYTTKYECNLTTYNGQCESIIIKCPVHGDFLTTPRNFRHNNGCAECGRSGRPYRMTTELYKVRIGKLFNNKYDLTKLEYKGMLIPVILGCPNHGMFSIKPDTLARKRACPKCIKEVKFKEFKKTLLNCSVLHRGVYSYDNTVSILPERCAVITCKIHGDFKQRLVDHVKGHGCRKCSTLKIRAVKKYNNSEKLQIKYRTIAEYISFVIYNAK